MTTIKVLLATYNGEKYIIQQMQSIINQKDVIVDICVSDDGSTDKTLAMINETFPQIKTQKNIPGTGSAATNFLKMLVETDFNENFEYIAFSDQDDLWLPQKLSVAVQKLNEEKADLYCSNLTKWDENTGSFTLLKKDFPQKKFDYLFEGGSAGCTYVFTKSFAKSLKSFVLQLNTSNWKGFSHDWLVYFFARSRNYMVFIDENSYIHYRLHGNNVHGHLNKLSLRTIWFKISKVMEGYHEDHIKNYINYIDKNTEAYQIYTDFLGNYFSRNKMIWKYNIRLMRDNKKWFVFAVLNLIKL
ncbi:glycosyltransferase [Capnocytophaga canimorsus]|uniref:Family 2 glycosyl transferase n=2 Tax=Capnocytophaga canimorsus TaxID=28188 RepID=A0A0B7HI19_9FLAO|nr:glycosyltransferase [Capnocytophaga canimorsus]ATA77280.1 glycosyl transferase family 2 [Capnocytophaga canimorsus]AWL78744.1 glycosyl transferase family 2 [Capnocytophaga canimorsus]AYW37354.1 glycosyltransferase [Capnocytophaga canimorsus]MDT9500127.1 glycosyltransferase [Capnocytophaga canimorsus]PJI83559.1 rhamnosyltransferase [Capnocytophaga canimorsus]